MSDPLDATTGMLRSEIDTKVDLEVTKAKEAVRAEVRSELVVITKAIGAIEAQVSEQRHDIRNLRQGQDDLARGQVGLSDRLTTLESTVASGNREVLKKIDELTTQTTTITEETADGRKVTKHFRSWGTVATDIRKFWPHGVALFLGYKAFAGWMAAHGITWSTIWAVKR